MLRLISSHQAMYVKKKHIGERGGLIKDVIKRAEVNDLFVTLRC